MAAAPELDFPLYAVILREKIVKNNRHMLNEMHFMCRGTQLHFRGAIGRTLQEVKVILDQKLILRSFDLRRPLHLLYRAVQPC
jgi:hypothetical protein